MFHILTYLRSENYFFVHFWIAAYPLQWKWLSTCTNSSGKWHFPAEVGVKCTLEQETGNKTCAFHFALLIQVELSLLIPTTNMCRCGRELLLPACPTALQRTQHSSSVSAASEGTIGNSGVSHQISPVQKEGENLKRGP